MKYYYLSTFKKSGFRKLCIVFLLFAVAFDISAQNRGDVHGKVINLNQEAIAGATVTIAGHSAEVNTNIDGEYSLQNLPTGKLSITVSFTGYNTATADIDLQNGSNELNFTLDRDAVALEPVTITAQQREQQLLDIPITMSTVGAQMLENTNTRTMEQLAALIPGLNIYIQTPHRPYFVIRGLTSDDLSLTEQPRVSVYYNNVPTSRYGMSVAALYDMERIEVAKGPQGTLFGRGSQIGAVNFITKRSEHSFGGYLSAGIGNYAMKEVEGAINLPIVKDKLFARASGIYSYQDGYVTNTSGGKLNGRNTTGGRFSATYLPVKNLSFDLVVNYQKDDNPGTAFMSKRYPNANGISDIFQYEASFDEGKTWYDKRELLGTSLTAKYYFNENNYLSSITSYYNNTVDTRWDGDGTVAPAIDMAEAVRTKQFTQELRYNFSVNSRLNGFVGAGYWRENVTRKYWFGPDEQYMIYPLFEMMNIPGAPPMIQPDGTYYPMQAIPGAYLGLPYDLPLPTNHEEESNYGAVNYAYDIFADATYKLLPKLSITGGIRITEESFKTSTEAHLLGSVPSTLGSLLGSAPNFFFAPIAFTEAQRDFVSLTYRLNLKYDISASSNVYAGYAKGRRPNVLQFNSTQLEIMNAEKVHSFDAGFKWTAQQRFWFDMGVFYQLYNDFQTGKWIAGNYLTDNAGRATSYGAEITAKAALLKYLEIFGNYAYIHARFNDEDSDGNRQEYAGKTFRMTPENSFSIGFNAKIDVFGNLQIALTPTYSWKSHIWFDDSNDAVPENPSLARLEQDAFGLLNVNLAFRLHNPGLTLSVFGTNLTDEKYIIGAGNTGMMFGVPTYVPGLPRMFGARLTWKFACKD